MKKLALIGAVAMLGCSPSLRAVTVAPPGRQASLDGVDDVVTVSEGAAIGVNCTHWNGEPCIEMQASTDHPSVAKVYRAHLAKLDHPWWNPQTVTTLVVVGAAPGETTLRVGSGGYTKEYRVVVVGGSKERAL